MTETEHLSSELVFLKLGGSLITDKSTPHTPNLKILKRLAEECAAALSDNPGLKLLLGHGSGSFGHVPAKRYGTRHGVRTPQQWQGFVEVWREANHLNRLVMDTLADAGIPALSFPPSAAVTAEGGQPVTWDLGPIKAALASGLLPVVFGDAIFDRSWGGTIFSTEDLFMFLTPALRPERVLIAGIEPGVWADYPACQQLIPEITPANLGQIEASLSGSAAPDVTGGMASKVTQMLVLTRQVAGLEVQIFSGEEPGTLLNALNGERFGTIIRANRS